MKANANDAKSLGSVRFRVIFLEIELQNAHKAMGIVIHDVKLINEQLVSEPFGPNGWIRVSTDKT